jgi:diguanylate cyclase (GGDEF)-like protein
MILERVRRGQHVVQFDTQRLRKDGSVFDISLTNSPIRDSSGTVVAVASIVRDVSVRKRLEQALQESQIELRAFLDGLRAAVMVHGADTRIRFANPEASRLLGLGLPQILGREARDGRWKFLREDGSVMPPEAYPVSVVMLTHAPVLDCVLGVQLPPPGGLRWVLANAVPRLAANGSVREVIVSLADITERRRLEEELARQAGEDALTGLSTRRRFFELADREVRRVQRQQGALSMLMLDVDHFKSINDEYGHQAGDAVLQELGHRIREMLRDVDIAGRLGGEEFAIVLPDTAQARAMDVAERLRKAVAQAPVRLPDGAVLHFTASIGVSTAEPGDRGIDAIIARADGALYHAKRSGRNTVRPVVGLA